MPHESSDEQSESQKTDQGETSLIQIDLSPEFQRNLRELSKRYRSIQADIQVVVQDLEVGNFVGDRITGVGADYTVLKLRVRNRDIKKGKSAGYRLIYQVESPTSILLLTIYAKSDRPDISAGEILEILGEV
jgi:mRNA-degrading endonuclease RelE of RelBE toxin-antitoxin system